MSGESGMWVLTCPASEQRHRQTALDSRGTAVACFTTRFCGAVQSQTMKMTFTCALPRRNFSNQYDGMKPLTDFPALLLDSVPILAEILC